MVNIKDTGCVVEPEPHHFDGAGDVMRCDYGSDLGIDGSGSKVNVLHEWIKLDPDLFDNRFYQNVSPALHHCLNIFFSSRKSVLCLMLLNIGPQWQQ
jgi:hypothetical protein